MVDEQGDQAQIKKDSRSIYDTGYGSIFLKNFVAGFSRALGAIIVYIFLGGLIYYLAVTYILPQVRNILPESIPLFGPQATTLSPEQLEDTLELLQRQPGSNQLPTQQQ